MNEYSSTVVFKQRYNSRSKPKSAWLNVWHLQYIATRPGAVYNRGCGFGLWGQLPGMNEIQDLTRLSTATQAVRHTSANHTVYRVVISVGVKTAREKGMYQREAWEDLVKAKVSAIAKEMDIKPENFCWCASMHCEPNHPHVHIMYWDNSNEPRPEAIPEPLFVGKAERIRAAFAGELYREEIRQLQQGQEAQAKELRQQLRSVCLEANPQKGLSLSRLYASQELDGLSEKLQQLLHDMPATGSLRYGYLPKEYKAQVNAFIEECLKISELGKEYAKYEDYTRRISKLYANGKDTVEQNLEKAKAKLYRELGNQVMSALKDVQQELRGEAQKTRPLPPAQALPLPDSTRQAPAPNSFQKPEFISEPKPGAGSEVSISRDQLRELLRSTVPQLLPSLDSYAQLQQLLPKERIPFSEMKELPGYREAMEQVVEEVSADARIRRPIETYARQTEDFTLDGTGNRWMRKEEYRDYQKLMGQAQSDIRYEITQQLREDAGWNEEMIRTGTAMLLCGMLRLASQMTSQRNADLARERLAVKFRSKDKTIEAKRDYYQTQSSPGAWSQDF